MQTIFLTRYTKNVAIVLFFVFATVSCGLYIFFRNDSRDNIMLQFVDDTKPTTGYISNQMNIYTDILYGVRAFFNASQSVEPDEWHDYVSALDLARNYPGVTSLFYAAKTNPKTSPFVVYPPTGDTVTYPITYLEPIDTAKAKAIGFNVASESNRLKALGEAIRTDQPTATPLILSAITNVRIISIYIPIYTKGSHSTYEERKASVQGFATVSFKIEDIFAYFIEHMAMKDTIGLKVYDAASLFDANPSTLLFDSTKGQTGTSDIVRTDTIAVAGRSWLLVYTALPGYSTGADSTMPLMVLIGGMIFAITIPSLLYYLVQHKLTTTNKR